MGRVMLKTFEDRGVEVVAVVDRLPITLNMPCYQNILDVKEMADIIVDFSHHSATREILHFATSKSIPLIIATTAQTTDEIDMIKDASKVIPIFFEHNMSMGIALIKRIVKQVASALPFADMEIVESHHNGKRDMPSGTAKSLRDCVLHGIQDSIAQNDTTNTLSMQNDHINNDYCNNEQMNAMSKRGCKNIPIHSLRLGVDVGLHKVIFDTGCERVVISHQAFSRTIYAEGAMSAIRFLIAKDNGLYCLQDIMDTL